MYTTGNSSATLYGREEQLAVLREAFRWTSLGAAELVLVSGAPGVGKTAFVLNGFKPEVAGKCYFAWSKFDLYSGSEPYGALIQCFQFVIRRLLTESEASVRKWKRRLQEAVGNNGSAIIEVIPEAKLLLEEAPALEALPAMESHNRFELVFRRFVRVFTSANYPLVLFLDDIQRADRATLLLLQALIDDPESRHLLIIGAYRDKEVATAELFETWLNKQLSVESVRRLALEPLALTHVQEIVADTLQAPLEQCFPAAHALYVKSIGNPLYLKQLLQSAIEEGMLLYDGAAKQWTWDIERLHQFPGIDGQIEYLIDTINKLPPDSRELLVRASCLGGKFRSDVLAAISGTNESDIAFVEALAHAARAGLLASSDGAAALNVYFFTHDRIHQAAYCLLDDNEGMRLHLAAGLFLQAQGNPADREQELFDIANHLYKAGPLLSEAEREQACLLNEAAGRRAMLASDFAAAAGYFGRAIDGLPEDGWESRFSFTFQLHLRCAECEYLCLEFERAERRLEETYRRSNNWMLRAQVVRLKISQYSNMGKYTQAIGLALDTLAEIGIRIPVRPSALTVKREMLRTQWLLGNRPEQLYGIEATDDDEVRMATELFGAIVGPAFFSNREMLAVAAAKFIRYISKQGAPSSAPVAYAAFAMVLTTMRGDFTSGYRLGQIAVDIADRSGMASLKAKVYVLFYCVVAPWMKLDDSLEARLREAAQLALETGDYVHGGYAIGGLINLAYATHSTKQMHMAMRRYWQMTELIQEEVIHINILIYKDLAEQWQTSGAGQPIITAGRSNEEQFLDEVSRAESRAVTLYQIYTYKTQINWMFHQYLEAIHYAQLAAPYESLAVQSPHLPMHHFYEALALAALLRQSSGDRTGLWAKRLKALRLLFHKWSRMSPIRFRHKYLLVQAEWLRVKRNEEEAIGLYDQSIRLSRECGDIQVLAVASECAARYHAERGRERMASSYMHEAYDAYGEWGVERKRFQLREEHPSWFIESQSAVDAQPEPLAGVEADEAKEANDRSGNDLLLIVKESLALFPNMNFSDIRERMAALLMQTSSASYGCLFAQRESGLQAELALFPPPHSSESVEVALDNCEAAPRSIVLYVARLGKPVQLQHAFEDDLFRYDPYMIKKKAGKVCCLPIYAENQFAGVLYLELPQDVELLPEQRIDALGILAAQTLFMLRLSETFGELSAGDTQMPHSSSEDEDWQEMADPLTDREMEVLHLMAAGMTNKEIAIRLGIAAGTVKVHIHNIFSKLNVNRRTKAIAEAVKRNLLASVQKPD